jgi:hypothetical protein
MVLFQWNEDAPLRRLSPGRVVGGPRDTDNFPRPLLAWHSDQLAHCLLIRPVVVCELLVDHCNRLRSRAVEFRNPAALEDRHTGRPEILVVNGVDNRRHTVDRRPFWPALDV